MKCGRRERGKEEVVCRMYIDRQGEDPSCGSVAVCTSACRIAGKCCERKFHDFVHNRKFHGIHFSFSIKSTLVSLIPFLDDILQKFDQIVKITILNLMKISHCSCSIMSCLSHMSLAGGAADVSDYQDGFIH